MTDQAKAIETALYELIKEYRDVSEIMVCSVVGTLTARETWLFDRAVSISRASQGSREGTPPTDGNYVSPSGRTYEEENVERVAREIDPDAWKDSLPIPTRDDVISFHARRQASCEVARRVIAALSPPATPYKCNGCEDTGQIGDFDLKTGDPDYEPCPWCTPKLAVGAGAAAERALHELDEQLLLTKPQQIEVVNTLDRAHLLATPVTIGTKDFVAMCIATAQSPASDSLQAIADRWFGAGRIQISGETS